MKKSKKLIPAAIGALFLAAGAQAAVIDFSEVPLLTTDPIIGGVSFWAGDPAAFNDTYTDDYWTAPNPYLASGHADGYLGRPSTGYSTFIGVSRTTMDLFDSVSFDIASEFNLPNPGHNTTLLVQAYFAGSFVGSASVDVSDSSYHTLALASIGIFDSLRISDDVNSFGESEDFHIDNFVYTNYQANPAPEPAMLLLLGAGLAGMAFTKRRKPV